MLRSKCARGIASIEFVLMLPTLVVFIIFILWIYKVHDGTLRVLISAEQSARQSDCLAEENHALSNLDELRDLRGSWASTLVQAFNSELSIGSGWIVVQEREDCGNYPGSNQPVKLVEQGAILSHAMGSGVLNFPQTSSEQPPLTLPHGTQGLMPGLSFRLDLMRSLLQ